MGALQIKDGLKAKECIQITQKLAETGNVDFLNTIAGAPYDDLGLAGWVPPMSYTGPVKLSETSYSNRISAPCAIVCTAKVNIRFKTKRLDDSEQPNGGSQTSLTANLPASVRVTIIG